MKARLLIVSGILAIAICGAVEARSISYDSGQWNTDPNLVFPGTISSTGGTLNVDGSSRAFAPGGTSTVSTPPAVPFASGINMFSPEYEFNWGTDATTTATNSNGILEQVIVTLISDTASNKAFTVDFNYLNASCSKETGTFSIGGATYSATDPCAANQKASLNEFSVSNGKVIAPAGWKPTTTTAPEMDPNSAFSALTLLLGSLAVMLSKRTSQQAGNQA
jgi:hypothetical protein